MDGLRIKTCGFRQALGGPAGGSRQKRRHALGPQDGQDTADDGGLTNAGTARNDQDLRRQGPADAIALTRREPHAEARFNPVDGLFRIDRWPWRSSRWYVPDGQCDRVFGMAQMRQEHTRLIIDSVGDYGAGGELEYQGIGQQPTLDLEKLLGERQKLGLRQTAIAVLDRLQQGVGDAGTCPYYRGLRDAKLLGDLVGGYEADAANVAGKAIGVLLDQWDRVGAVGLEDTDRPRCADAVTL